MVKKEGQLAEIIQTKLGGVEQQLAHVRIIRNYKQHTKRQKTKKAANALEIYLANGNEYDVEWFKLLQEFQVLHYTGWTEQIYSYNALFPMFINFRIPTTN